MTLRTVGSPELRTDAVAKATGGATFGVDVQVPGMLVGRVLRAGIPHARINGVDTTAAEQVPGVKAVLTGRDYPRRHGPLVADQPALALDRVRYEGEIVAAVAATDEDAAAEALDAIVVDYDPLPVVDSLEAAMAPDAPLLHEDQAAYRRVAIPGIRVQGEPGTNIAYTFRLDHGDVERGFDDADVVLEDTYTTQFIQYAHLEPHVTVARFDGSTMTVWTSTMGPHTLRNMLADFLDLPQSDVRVITNLVGGAYGSKMYLRAINPVAALLARRLPNRSIRVVFDREDEFLTSPGRLPAEVAIRTGARSDGTLLAREAHVRWNQGAYIDLGPMVARNAGYVSLGPYRIPNARVRAQSVYSNRQPGGAFRGLGVPQMAWAGEQQIDRLARELDLDPIELRRRNLLDDGDTTITGEHITAPGARACLEAAAAALDAKPPATASDGRRIGRGAAVVMKSTLTPTASFGTVKLNPDGTVDVISAAVEHGQGAHTVLAQLVAEELALPLDRVRCVQPDTAVAPYDRSSTSSRTTFTMGNVLRNAAIEVRDQLLEIASDVLEIATTDLELVDGAVRPKDDPRAGLTYAALLDRHYKGPASVTGRGDWDSVTLYDPMDPDTGRSRRPSAFWMFGAAAAETSVDPETGEVQVLRLVTAVDAGKAINPRTCEQQIAGQAVMGLGMTLLEELVFSHGQTMNPTFLDYKVPTTLDVPDLESVIVETADEHGPHGARGVGEVGLAAVPAAIGNSAYAATGVQLRDLPLRAERVRAALRAAAEDGRST